MPLLPMGRVLVVDDEVDLAQLVAGYLRKAGLEVAVRHDGTEAVAAVREYVPDVLVLDLGLPGTDGIEVCRQVRTFSDCHVLMLTARDDEVDKIVGLSVGADDYVTKPFSLEELVARLRGLMRRSGAQRAADGSVLRVGDLELDEDSHEVSRGGEEIALTATEFELLRFLMRNPRRVLSKAQILDRVWNYDFGGQANVVELYSLLVKDKDQLTYYNSGIGTYVKDSNGLKSWFSLGSWRQWISQTRDIIVAWCFFSSYS